MASQYPHGHAYDLFVSCSNTNIEWVQAFHDGLVADINQFAVPKVICFFDKDRIQPGFVWNEQLAAAASDSAVFVPILSLPFFESPYCQKELTAFLEAKGLAADSAHRSRILPVKLLSSAPSDHVLAQVQAASFCSEGSDGIPFEHARGTGSSAPPPKRRLRSG